MRVAVITPQWGRHRLAPIWWRAVRRLQGAWLKAGHETLVVVSGSEQAHRFRCANLSGHWIEVENHPLGRKWNRTMQRALELGAEYVLILGADDVLSPEIVRAYLPHMEKGTKYVGLEAVYCYEPETWRSCRWQYPRGHDREGEPMGAGRLIHRSLLSRTPWEDTRETGLDQSMTQRLQLPEAELIPVTTERVALDIKTAENIWSFEHMSESRGALEQREGFAFDALPEWSEIEGLRESPARV